MNIPTLLFLKVFNFKISFKFDTTKIKLSLFKLTSAVKKCALLQCTRVLLRSLQKICSDCRRACSSAAEGRVCNEEGHIFFTAEVNLNKLNFIFVVSNLNDILNLKTFKNNNVGMFILLLYLYKEMEYAST